MKKYMFMHGIIFISCIIALSTISACASSEEETESILVYCGAGMSKPMDEIGRVFFEKYNVEVRYNYAGANTLLSQMELIREGDAYMPGATIYIEIAEEKGLVDYSQLICYHIPVITVPKGNPAGITCLEDLGRPGIRLVWGDPEAAAIGKVGNKILEKNGIYDSVWSNVIATLPTMNEVMMQISLGQADASINWWDTVKTVEDIDVIEITDNQNIISIVPIGITTFTKKEDITRIFVDFCASDKGKGIFETYGFKVYPNLDH